jgi:hypothetical protein
MTESPELFVLLYKTGYGGEGYPVGVFTSPEYAKTAILDHEKKRSASYNESGVLYEIYVCKISASTRTLLYSESHKITTQGILHVTTTDYTEEPVVVNHYSQRV